MRIIETEKGLTLEKIHVLVNNQWTQLKHEGDIQEIQVINTSANKVPVYVRGDTNFMNFMDRQGKSAIQTSSAVKFYELYNGPSGVVDVQFVLNNEIINLLVNNQWTQLKHEGDIQEIQVINTSANKVPVYVRGDTNFMNFMDRQGKSAIQTSSAVKFYELYNGPSGVVDIFSGPSPTTIQLQKLKVVNVSARDIDGKHVPANVYDGIPSTRWSGKGIGSWIELDLGGKQEIHEIDIDWYKSEDEGIRTNKINLLLDSVSKQYEFGEISSKIQLQPPIIAGKVKLELLETSNLQKWFSINDISILGKQLIEPQHRPTEEPEVGDYPLSNVQWVYNSDAALSKPGVYQTKQRHPNDKVLLFSNASSVDNHKIEDGWLIINTGNEFGRVYWECYELPEFKSTKLGFTTILAGIFKMTKLGESDFSVKDGDHGTDSYEYDGKKFFGGFGWSAKPNAIESKCEWKHDTPEGNEEKFPYGEGKKLKLNEEYPFFSIWVADQSANTCTLNVWLKFEDDKWSHVVKDRVWKHDSEWKDKSKSIPKDALDYEDVQKGPGHIKRDHIWTRANQGDVLVKNIKIGTMK